MSGSSQTLIVGAGVLGLCAAFELYRRGHELIVVDSGGENASSVAAGMIAPAMESAIDGLSPDHARLLSEARDLWPQFAEAAGIVLRPRLTEWRGADPQAMADRLKALGFEAEITPGGVVRTREDFQVSPEAALAALRRVLGSAVISARASGVAREHGGWRIETSAGSMAANRLVLATGVAPALPGLPETATRLIDLIQPIRGQIGRLASGGGDAVMRGPGAYVAPRDGGSVVGATMEAGVRDLTPDPMRGARMLADASAFVDGLPAEADWRVGLRGATPDGLPMAGRSDDGVHLALGPRRNGWLLGPMVAAVVADGIEGRKTNAFASALDPLRFLSSPAW